MLLAALITALFAGICLNCFVRKTNGYKNFYRSIHVMKDVVYEHKYAIGTFGSTFAYYAFNLKKYNGHNFSVAPQTIFYMEKTIKHFLNNIERGGYVVFSLAGCMFAADDSGEEENTLTYYSYLSKEEFGKYRLITKLKYFLTRYFPAANPNLLKCLIHDQELLYDQTGGISPEQAEQMAQKRIRGWERVLGISNMQHFQVSPHMNQVMDKTTKALENTISFVQANGRIPVLLVLPITKQFRALCPDEFFDQCLYSCLNKLKNKNVLVLDYLDDEALSNPEYYWSADCLNKRGREILTDKMVYDLKKKVSNND